MKKIKIILMSVFFAICGLMTFGINSNCKILSPSTTTTEQIIAMYGVPAPKAINNNEKKAKQKYDLKTDKN